MNEHAYLNSFINLEQRLDQSTHREFNLERVKDLLNAVGNPQNKFKVIHVAGTKGKGSVCAYISYILRAAGFRVGLYTSPHLHQLNERMRLLVPEDKVRSGDFLGQISDRDLTQLINDLRPKIDPLRQSKIFGPLTFFEVFTTAALYYFAQKKADFVVLETGLGGRLDATNAVDSMVDVITTIGLDHMHLLGNTLTKIAAEKAAIIKNRHSAVVISHQKDRALRVILKRCREFSIHPVCIGRDVTWRLNKQTMDGQQFEIATQRRCYKNLKTVLWGEHQLMNAATAVGAVEALSSFGIKIAAKAIKSGISQTKWPGRLEIVRRKPCIMIDCAHNVDSAEVLVKTFTQSFPHQKAVVILGMSQDKDIQGFCRVIKRIASRIIFTRVNHPRAFDFTHIDVQSLVRNVRIDHCPEVGMALSNALTQVSKDSIILITGSVFVAAQAREAVKHVSMEKSR